MPTRKEQFTPGEFYHIFNQGNGKQNIFRDDRDRYRFLQAMYASNNSNSNITIGRLERHKGGYTLADIQKIFNDNKIDYDPLVRIITDCLMPNHFHLFLQEIQPGGIVKFMQRACGSYAKYFTTKHERPGSLFRSRFKAVHIETDNQLRYLLGYINFINPAQLIEPNLKEEGIKDFDKVLDGVLSYKWCGNPEFLGMRNSILIDKGLLGEIYQTPEIYLEFMKNILRGKERNFWTSADGFVLE